MIDGEKVINGLRCIKGDLILCVYCAYSDGNGHGTYSCKAFCANDAITMLKEQEAKEQISDAIHETAKQFRQTIVLCKDCKYYDSFSESCRNGIDGIMTPNFYCGNAERKEGEIE